MWKTTTQNCDQRVSCGIQSTYGPYDIPTMRNTTTIIGLMRMRKMPQGAQRHGAAGEGFASAGSQDSRQPDGSLCARL